MEGTRYQYIYIYVLDIVYNQTYLKKFGKELIENKY